MSPLSIEFVIFEIGDYPMSLIEFLGTTSGLLSVWWAAKANILTWPSGLINIFCFFLLFYQSQLYSDMFLQIFFFVSTVYGWKMWTKKEKETKSKKYLSAYDWFKQGLFLMFGTILWGALMSNIHVYLPGLFPQKASLPYLDAFTAISSVSATILLAQKKWESWILWVIIDAFSIYVYFYKQLYVVAFEYVIFLFIASYGLYNWRLKNMKLIAGEVLKK